jgi:hypothetical protein
MTRDAAEYLDKLVRQGDPVIFYTKIRLIKDIESGLNRLHTPKVEGERKKEKFGQQTP